MKKAFSAILLLPAWVARWALQIALKLPLFILGLFVMPAMYQYRYTPLNELKWYQRMFANPEDWHGGFLNYEGSVPPWFKKKMSGSSEFWQFYKYHAIRNPSDGLRNYPSLQLQIDKDRVQYWTPEYMEHYDPWYSRTPKVRGYIAWQGIYMGFKVQWVREKAYTELKWGFRVEPRDAHEELAENSARRALGASMSNKFIINRELT